MYGLSNRIVRRGRIDKPEGAPALVRGNAPYKRTTLAKSALRISERANKKITGRGLLHKSLPVELDL